LKKQSEGKDTNALQESMKQVEVLFAGPVVAAACILSKNFLLKNINDSKKLTFDLRYQLYQE